MSSATITSSYRYFLLYTDNNLQTDLHGIDINKIRNSQNLTKPKNFYPEMLDIDALPKIWVVFTHLGN